MPMKRNMSLVVAARLLSRMGGTAAFFIGIWGFAAYRFNASAPQLARLMLGVSVASIVGALVAGVLVDRFGPRVVVIVAELLVIPVALLIMRAGTLGELARLAWLVGLLQAPIFTATASFAPYFVREREQLERANSWIEGAGSVGFIMGPAAGAVIARFAGVEWVFAFTAVCSVAAAAVAWFIRLSHEKRPSSSSHPLTELREGLRAAYSNPALRFAVLCGTGMWFSFGAFSALEPLFYRDVAKASVEWIGWMNTGFGIGMVAGAWLLPRAPQRVLSLRGVTVTVALVGLGAVLYVGSPDLRVIGAGALAWGVIIGFAEPLLRTIIHLESPHEFVGRITGVTQLHRSAGEIVPLAFAPALAAVFGVQPVLIGGGVMLALAMAAVWGYARRLDHVAAIPAEAPATQGVSEAA